MKNHLLALIIFCAIIPFLASAQNLQSLSGQSDAILITTTPARPGPSQTVTVSIESYALDLDRADISWFLNNTLQAQKIGQKTLTFKTGKAGSLSNILIVVKTADGEITQQTLNIRPASVDIIYEAQSYAPPFYLGKALYPPQGTVKVVALPNFVTTAGGTIDSNTLVYNWKVNGNPVTSASGYSKNYILFTGSVPLKPAKISVEVASIDQAYIAESSVTLAPASPQVVFYEDNPLLGILFNKALTGNARLQNEELTITAIPYFMGASLRDGDGLLYEWNMNNQKVATTDSNTSSLAFRQEKGAQGTAGISLQISRTDKIFQFTRGNLTLMFGNTSAF